MSSLLGKNLRLSTFGESHGKAIGGVLDGFPSGLNLDLDFVNTQLARRKPGQSNIVTQRKEDDNVEFFSGIAEGISTGTPIGFQILNKDQRSKDYSNVESGFRPSHADYTYTKKYGLRDHRGGGRSSARETANWVAAGSLCKSIIPKVEINAYVSSVGNISLDKGYELSDKKAIEENIVRCPDKKTAESMIELIRKVKKAGDSIGGCISCIIKNVPIGLGEPVFDKLQSSLAKAMMSINAAKGFEYGSGFEGTKMLGSEHNDVFESSGRTKTNYSGGIQGGISNGMDIYFNVAFKPVSTILMPQKSIDDSGNEIDLQVKGRHDPCVVPRAVPIVEALSYFVIADAFISNLKHNLPT